MYGRNGNDILNGGLGNDYLDGGNGADIYCFQLGDGNDTLNDSSSDNSIDQLIFSGVGLTASNIIVTRIGTSSDLKISFRGNTADSIILKDQIYNSVAADYGIEQIQFSDGVIWTEQQLWNSYRMSSAPNTVSSRFNPPGSSNQLEDVKMMGSMSRSSLNLVESNIFTAFRAIASSPFPK